MTPESQRKAIGEFCFKNVRWHYERLVHGSACTIDVPDYPNDLNAMHEAEKILTLEQWDDYTDNFERVCKTDGWQIMDTLDRKAIVHATAAQRAEAFLKTVGKWEN